MANIEIYVTDAGIAEIINAEKNGTAPVVLTEIGLGTGKYAPLVTQTELKEEFKRIDAISGGAIGDNILHITLRDVSADAYDVFELGVYTDTGVLFAVSSQTTPILTKSAAEQAILALDFLISNIKPESVTFGDVKFDLNSATTEMQGIVELATEDEVKAGEDETRAVTPATLKAALENFKVNGGLDNVVHLSGDETITGAKTFDANVTVNGSIYSASDDECINICGGENVASGAYIRLDSKDNSTPGVFRIVANNGTTTKTLLGKPDGALMWDGKYITLQGDCLPLIGGKMTGTLVFDLGNAITRADSKGYLHVCGGASTGSGAILALHGADYSSNNPGNFGLTAKNSSESAHLTGSPGGVLRWKDKNIVRSVDGVDADAEGNVSLSALKTTGGTMTGNIYSASRDECINICGGENVASGAYIRLDSKDSSTPGVVRVVANDGTNTKALRLTPDGSATWDGQELLTGVGAVIPFANNVTPSGYLYCNGAEVSRTTYAALFAAIGTTYGAGDGSTTFNLPDLRGKFVEGAYSTDAGTVKEAGLPNITGEYWIGDKYAEGRGSGAFSIKNKTSSHINENGVAGTSSIMTFDASRSNAIYGKSSTVQPPATMMRYCIKY